MSLLVFGTIALDDVKTPSGLKKGMLGGSAAHCSMSARFLTDVHLAGVVGKDFPKKHIDLFKRKKVNTDSLTVMDGATFHWEGEYKIHDLNTAVTHKTELGVLAVYTPKISENQRRIPHLFLANYDPENQMKMLKLIRNPQLVGLDSMNLWINHQKSSLLKLVKQVNLFVLNDAEARSLSGEHNLIKAAKALLKLGPQIIIIKKGEHGVFILSPQGLCSYAAFPVEKVVDPTGAGDTFAGGMMGYLSRVKKINLAALKKASVYATVLSSFNVEGFGMSRTALLAPRELSMRVKHYLKFINPE